MARYMLNASTMGRRERYSEVVELLLAKDDVDPDVKAGQYDHTVLFLAAKGGHEAVIKVLLERGKVDINATDKIGRTALMLAAESGREAVVRLLLQICNANINATDINWPDSVHVRSREWA